MKTAASLFAALVLLSCQRESKPVQTRDIRITTSNIPSNVGHEKAYELIRPNVPAFLESARLGAKLGADGTVSADETTIPPGQPVHLTLKLKESPPGLQTHVVWMDASRKELKRELHPMNGAKVVTFTMAQLPPGRYHAEGYWGGNLAAEKDFEVTAPPRPKKKG